MSSNNYSAFSISAAIGADTTPATPWQVKLNDGTSLTGTIALVGGMYKLTPATGAAWFLNPEHVVAMGK